jgi:hypothetical protein
MTTACSEGYDGSECWKAITCRTGPPWHLHRLLSWKPGAFGRASPFNDMEPRYLIAGPKDPSNNEQLYWSSKYGWVALASAERFTAADREFNRLPPESHWVQDE